MAALARFRARQVWSLATASAADDLQELRRRRRYAGYVDGSGTAGDQRPLRLALRRRDCRMGERGIVLLATASSVTEARATEAAGIDAVVAQGIEAGGHRGVFDPAAPDDARRHSPSCRRQGEGRAWLGGAMGRSGRAARPHDAGGDAGRPVASKMEQCRGSGRSAEGATGFTSHPS